MRTIETIAGTALLAALLYFIATEALPNAIVYEADNQARVGHQITNANPELGKIMRRLAE